MVAMGCRRCIRVLLCLLQVRMIPNSASGLVAQDQMGHNPWSPEHLRDEILGASFLQIGNPRQAVLIGDAEEYVTLAYQEITGTAQNDSSVLESVIVLTGRWVGQYKIHFSFDAFQFTSVRVGKRLEGVRAHEFGLGFDPVQPRVLAGCGHIVFRDVESNHAAHFRNSTGSNGETSAAASPIDPDAVKQVFVYTDGLD